MRYQNLLFLCICLFVLAACPAFSAEPESAPPAQSDMNVPIASVNDVPISKKDFVWAFSSHEQRLTSMGKLLSEDEVRELKKNTFDQLVNREILFQESRKKNIQVSEQKVEEEYARIQASMMSDIDYKNIKKELDMQEKDIKNEFRRVFAIEALLDQELHFDDTVSEKQTRDFYDKNPDKFIVRGPARFSHILVEVKEDADEPQKAEARKKIAGIADKVKKGENFADLARTSSDDKSSGAMGGDIGWVQIGRTVKPFEDAAFALEPGEISGIVETPYGFHLIKMLEKKPETVFTYDQMKGKIAEYLKEEKRNQCETAYIEKLKKGAKIQHFMDPMQIR